LIVDPDTTSGGGYRQNQHAGQLTMSMNKPRHHSAAVQSQDRFVVLVNDQG
jgi:hypothetical protein